MLLIMVIQQSHNGSGWKLAFVHSFFCRFSLHVVKISNMFAYINVTIQFWNRFIQKKQDAQGTSGFYILCLPSLTAHLLFYNSATLL